MTNAEQLEHMKQVTAAMNKAAEGMEEVVDLSNKSKIFEAHVQTGLAQMVELSDEEKNTIAVPMIAASQRFNNALFSLRNL